MSARSQFAHVLVLGLILCLCKSLSLKEDEPSTIFGQGAVQIGPMHNPWSHVSHLQKLIFSFSISLSMGDSDNFVNRGCGKSLAVSQITGIPVGSFKVFPEHNEQMNTKLFYTKFLKLFYILRFSRSSQK